MEAFHVAISEMMKAYMSSLFYMQKLLSKEFLVVIIVLCHEPGNLPIAFSHYFYVI